MHKCIKDLRVASAVFSGQQKATEVSFEQIHGCNFAPVGNFGSPAAQWGCLFMHTFVFSVSLCSLRPLICYNLFDFSKHLLGI